MGNVTIPHTLREEIFAEINFADDQIIFFRGSPIF